MQDHLKEEHSRLNTSTTLSTLSSSALLCLSARMTSLNRSTYNGSGHLLPTMASLMTVQTFTSAAVLAAEEVYADKLRLGILALRHRSRDLPDDSAHPPQAALLCWLQCTHPKILLACSQWE